MTDRELLELAAKAAGYEWRKDIAEKRSELGEIALWIVSPMKTAWNPLDDDGDALRLAVKLRMLVDADGEVYPVATATTKGTGVGADVQHNDDPYAATRHAIVRAAAEIGKEMK